MAAKAFEDLAGYNREDAYNSLCLLFAMAKTGELPPLIKATEEHKSGEVRRARRKTPYPQRPSRSRRRSSQAPADGAREIVRSAGLLLFIIMLAVAFYAFHPSFTGLGGGLRQEELTDRRLPITEPYIAVF